MAKVKSDGVTAKSGGQYDWTNKGSLKTQIIDDTLFAIPVGAMSQILESDSGFHIVRVLERKDAGRKPFTDVQVEIRDKLKDERLHAAQDKYLEQLRSRGEHRNHLHGQNLGRRAGGPRSGWDDQAIGRLRIDVRLAAC